MSPVCGLLPEQSRRHELLDSWPFAVGALRDALGVCVHAGWLGQASRGRRRTGRRWLPRGIRRRLIAAQERRQRAGTLLFHERRELRDVRQSAGHTADRRRDLAKVGLSGLRINRQAIRKGFGNGGLPLLLLQHEVVFLTLSVR